MAIRTYGLSGSGIDVDEQVKTLMKAKRVQYDSLYKKKTQLEWKKTDYSTMYTSISDFRNVVFSNKLQSNLSPRKASSSNTGAVTATANADAANMTHTVEVSKLAAGVQRTSDGTITTGNSKDTLMSQFGMSAGNFSIRITNGASTAEVNIDATQSIYDVVANINKAGVNVKANYDANLDRFFLATADTGEKVSLDFTGSSAMGLDFITNKLKIMPQPSISTNTTSSVQVDATLGSLFSGFSGGVLSLKNGTTQKNVTLSANDTISSMIYKIQGAGGLNATASFSADGKFTLQATSGILDVSGSDASVLSLLKDKLNLTTDTNALKTIGTKGLTSSTAIAAPASNIKLDQMFTGLAGKSTLVLNGKSIVIDFATDSLSNIVKKIQDSGGAAASYDPSTRKVTIGAADLSGSDLVAKKFLKDTLKLDVPDATATTLNASSSSAELFPDPMKQTIAEQFGLAAGATYRFHLTNSDGTDSGKTVNDISIDTSTDTLATFIDKLNKAGVNVTASYNYSTNKVTIKPSKGSLSFSGSDSAAITFLSSKLKIQNVNDISYTSGVVSSDTIFTSEADKSVMGKFPDISGGRFTLKVNGSSVNIDTANDSIDDLLTKLNGTGAMTASYSNGKFSINPTGTLNLAGSDPAAIAFLTNNLKMNAGMSQHGNDAELVLDGASIKESSNTFTVAGVSYTLNDKTEVGKSVNVVITSDIDKTVDNVKKFVEAYNTMLKKLNDELKETKYKDYLPLTDDEKKSLSADQIKAWEDKAKSGILRNDPIISTLVTKMRNNFTDAITGINGSKVSASALGIDTSLGSYKDGGLLTVDENRLRRALNDDPDVVYKIFGTDGQLLTGNQKGVLPRMYDSLKDAMDKLSREGGATASADYDTKSNLGKEIKDYKTRMTNMKTMLADVESRYYKQFDAMEKALAKMQQQGSWISNMGK